MYTINFYERQFRSDENLQPVIDQLIIQSKLLGYSIFLSYQQSPRRITQYIDITKEKCRFAIRLFIDYPSNLLYKIELAHIKHLQATFQEERNNFSQLITQIIEKL